MPNISAYSAIQVLGLKWENIDFTFNRVHIVQSVGYERGYGIGSLD